MNWDPISNKFQHQCKKCGLVFWGRKNQVYCNPQCKSRTNNDTAATLNHEFQSTFEFFRKNLRVFLKIKHMKENLIVEMHELRHWGFNPEFSIKSKLKNESQVVYFISDWIYFFKISETKVQFKILPHGTY